MSLPRLGRWSGLSLMLGGITLAVHFLVHPAGETAQYTLYPLWGLAHWLGGLAGVLILFGLITAYLRQADRVGWLGLVGFILAFAGMALYAGGQVYFGAVVQPFIAANAPDWLEPGSALLTSPAYRLAEVVTFLPFLFGFTILGIAALRAAVLPRFGSWLMILVAPIGLLGLALLGSSLQGTLQILGGLVAGLGLLVWGYACWSGNAERVLQPA